MNPQWSSRLAWAGLLVFMLVVGLSRTASNRRAVIWSDAEGYYKYLPGLFLLGDFHRLEPGSIWPYYNDKGEFVNKYSCGIAYYQLPFFGMALLEHALRGQPTTDHYDAVFSRWMAVSGIVYAWLGLLILYHALRRTVSIRTAGWTVAAVFFGTNLYHYATKEMGISHVYSFFLFACLLHAIPAVLRRPGWTTSLVLGALAGSIILVRPTNIIVLILLLGMEVYSLGQLRDRAAWLWRNAGWLSLAAVVALLVWIPQFLYWHEMTGRWIYYSYTEEGFKFWKAPKIAAVLFDVQNGLFVYSPMALLMLAGVGLGLRKRAWHSPALLVIFCIATYLFASWWAWWFGGAFGHRCYVEYYALLALPLAGLLQAGFQARSAILRYALPILLVALMIYSVRLSHLYTTVLGGPWDGPDWRWNWDKYAWIMRHFFDV